MTPLLEDVLKRRPYNAVADFVDANVARGLGDKVAFTDSTRSLTYAQLQERSYRFAAALKALGLREERPAASLAPRGRPPRTGQQWPPVTTCRNRSCPAVPAV